MLNRARKADFIGADIKPDNEVIEKFSQQRYQQNLRKNLSFST